MGFLYAGAMPQNRATWLTWRIKPYLMFIVIIVSWLYGKATWSKNTVMYVGSFDGAFLVWKRAFHKKTSIKMMFFFVSDGAWWWFGLVGDVQTYCLAVLMKCFLESKAFSIFGHNGFAIRCSFILSLYFIF